MIGWLETSNQDDTDRRKCRGDTRAPPVPTRARRAPGYRRQGLDFRTDGSGIVIVFLPLELMIWVSSRRWSNDEVHEKEQAP